MDRRYLHQLGYWQLPIDSFMSRDGSSRFHGADPSQTAEHGKPVRPTLHFQRSGNSYAGHDQPKNQGYFPDNVLVVTTSEARRDLPNIVIFRRRSFLALSFTLFT